MCCSFIADWIAKLLVPDVYFDKCRSNVNFKTEKRMRSIFFLLALCWNRFNPQDVKVIQVFLILKPMDINTSSQPYRAQNLCSYREKKCIFNFIFRPSKGTRILAFNSLDKEILNIWMNFSHIFRWCVCVSCYIFSVSAWIALIMMMEASRWYDDDISKYIEN